MFWTFSNLIHKNHKNGTMVRGYLSSGWWAETSLALPVTFQSGWWNSGKLPYNGTLIRHRGNRTCQEAMAPPHGLPCRGRRGSCWHMPLRAGISVPPRRSCVVAGTELLLAGSPSSGSFTYGIWEEMAMDQEEGWTEEEEPRKWRGLQV